jgi:AraC-like DNA-binding protein
VASVWIQRVAPGSSPYTHRTIPHASVELSIEMGSSPQVVGPQTGPVEATLAPGTTVIGVRFLPGAAPSVLGVPASELVDLSVGANELWGPSAVALGEAIAAAATPQEGAEALERAIEDRLALAAAPDELVTAAVRSLMPWGADDVGSVTASLHISERQLRRRTRAAIGHAPKLVQRIMRFQGFLALAHAHWTPDADLALLAAEAGYADQAHLTRESVQLAGMPPRALLRNVQENCVGIHDHATSWVPLLRNRPVPTPA